MKKLYTLILALATTCAAQAQTYMRIWQAGESNKLTISEVGDMTFNGQTIDIQGTTYSLSDIDSLVIVPQIDVTWSGSSATVSVPAAIASDITVSTDGGYVTITNTNVSNEIEINLTGTTTDGNLTYNGSYKTTIRLNDVSITSQQGAALDIQDGKRIALVLTSGTFNYLTDCAGGTQKAALYCKGHMEIEGGGSLTVTGNTGHAISSKEYLQLKRSTGTITIAAAQKDAIHAGQHIEMRGGSVTWDSNTLGDGMQAEYDYLSDDVTLDPDVENTGALTVSGGTITGVVGSDDCKGMKSDGEFIVSGGTINIDANGAGSRGIQAEGNMTVSEDSNTTIININANGDRYTDPTTGDTSRCTGIRCKSDLTVNGGTITVTNTGSKSRAIRVTGTYTVNGGTVTGDVVNS